jgi:PadR family transcriptional regulator PadR
MDIQLKRGILEVCVLSALLGGESYGYKIIKDLSGHIEISESTLYPILRRLESGGALTSYTREHSGRLRKYHAITPSGKARVHDFLEDWKSIMNIYEYIRMEAEGP